jgi:copper transport protein
LLKNLSRILALALGLGFAVAGVGLAFAHASLLRSEPPANAVLADSPGQITVWFDEAVEPNYGNLAVYDAQGQRVDSLDTHYVPDTEPALSVSLPPLPQGAYIVVWRVVSTVDAHPVGGAFSFGIGVAADPTAAAAAAQEQANVRPDFTTHLIRYLSLLGEVLFLGAVVFRGLVWLPTVARSNVDVSGQRRYLTLLADVLRAALVIGLLGALYVQSRATEAVFWELLPTRWGVIWMVRAVAVFLAAAWMESLLAVENGERLWTGFVLSVTLLLTTVLTSHSSAKPGLLGPVADAAHLLAVSVWAGGLVMLCLTLLGLRASGAEARHRTASELVARFSGLAAVSVGLIVVSGLVLSAGLVRAWNGLLLTTYGQTLLWKLLVVAAAFGFGVYNSLVTRRKLEAAAQAGTGAPASQAGLSVGVEAALTAGVILFAAVLTNLPPATATNAALAPEQVGSELSLSAQADGLEVTTLVRPARVGVNGFEMGVAEIDGPPVSGLQIELTFQPVGGSGLVSTLTLVELFSGRYTAEGSPFNREGAWQVLATVRRPDGGLTYVPFNVEIGLDGVVRGAGQPVPVPVRAANWLNRYGNGALTGVILAVVAAWSWIAWRAVSPSRRARLWWLAIGLLFGAAVWLLLALRA